MGSAYVHIDIRAIAELAAWRALGESMAAILLRAEGALIERRPDLAFALKVTRQAQPKPWDLAVDAADDDDAEGQA